MVEYVYALHDFVPEHEDEVPFRAGERIEVVEKDDMYGDGWWQGRNLSGKVGLFPKSYTQPAPPSEPPAPQAPSSDVFDVSRSSPKASSLQPLQEEPEPVSVNGSGTPNGATSVKGSRENGEVMRATMTDVQKAIEQLGHDDFDGTRSIAFSSIREGDSTDHETETDTDAEGDNFYKDARQKLAEKARKQVEEERAREEAETQRLTRSSAPPIEVEVSDESEDEEEEREVTRHRRKHPHILEEEDEDDTKQFSPPIRHVQDSGASIETSNLIVPSEDYVVPSPHLKEDSELPTATQATFPTTGGDDSPLRTSERPLSASLPSPVSPTSNRPGSHLSADDHGSSSTSLQQHSAPLEKIPSQTLAAPVQTGAPVFHDFNGVLPSPAASSTGRRSNAPQPSETALSPVSGRTSSVHPSDWSVDDVVDWLRSKGFDEGVCEKFIEQEISGDVLLELDVDLLKTEIGILAFGKRKRIANAITELRRPPSVISSEHNATRSHSQSQSASYSLAPSSAQQSFNSPYTLAPSLSPVSAAGPQTNGSMGVGSIMSPESPPHTGDIAGTPAPVRTRPDSDPGVMLDLDADRSRATIGLGIGGVMESSTLSSVKTTKGRPSQLTLSPSDSALGVKAVSGATEEAEEERVVLSEGETAKNPEARTMRRRVFGRSESTSSKDKDSPSRISKEPSTPVSSVSPLDDNASKHGNRKRSIDATRGSDRLSIFGGAFAGSLGKSRKPPPRYSAMVDNADLSPDKGSRTLSRLYPGHGHRKTSGRPSTSDGVKPKDEKRDSKESKESKEKSPRDPAVLRKRTSSVVEPPSRSVTTLKAGQSILEQIGSPDHNGWMRKKGDRYNTWKSRYFVLKGPHLYWLRSNSTAETKIKGYINIVGYKLITDEKVDPGRYGFKMIHESDKTHFFSSEEQNVIREWMKALMKATIDRDYTKPVVSSVNIPTIPLTVAQAMNPAPRPPSPTARAATQKALRRENPHQLSTRDAQILMMGLPSSNSQASTKEGERARLDSFFTNEAAETPLTATTLKSTPPNSHAPARPSREMRRLGSLQSDAGIEPSLIEWANSHLPKYLKIVDTTGPAASGLTLLRLAEDIKGRPCSPPVPDSAFPSGPNDDKLDGLFRLFDFLLDNDVKMGSVSINDVRQGKRDKIVQLLKALKAWEDKRRAIAQSIGKGSMQAGPFIAPITWTSS